MTKTLLELGSGLIGSLPDECEATLDHAAVHVEHAGQALFHDDKDQAQHDALMAAKCLLIFAASLGETT